MYQHTGHILLGQNYQSTGRTPRLLFELKAFYPHLNFSVINECGTDIQITAIRVTKAASLKDNHSEIDFLLGTRLKLEWDLSRATVGKWGTVFGDDIISNLKPAESEAFQLTLSSENTLNLVDIKVEYISEGMDTPSIFQGEKVVVIHAPVERATNEPRAGAISLVDRSDALDALLQDSELKLWEDKIYCDCNLLRILFLRGAAYLSVDDLLGNWQKLNEKFHESEDFGLILTSFAEFGAEVGLPENLSRWLTEWAETPGNLQRLPIFDQETLSKTFATSLATLDHGDERVPDGVAPLVRMADSSLEIPRIGDDAGDEGFVKSVLERVSIQQVTLLTVERIISEYEIGCLEYLVALCVVEPLDPTPFHERVVALINDSRKRIPNSRNLLQQAETLKVGDGAKMGRFWLTWWLGLRDKERYQAFSWQMLSPRLWRSFQACLLADNREAAIKAAADQDPIVRISLARNPMTVLEALQQLALDSEVEIRREVAVNPSTPIDVLRQLASDQSSLVRRWVAAHTTSDSALLRQLSIDECEEVRQFVASNPRSPL